MSNKKKPKKLRRPNIPVTAGNGVATAVLPVEARGGGVEAVGEPRVYRAEAARGHFDYTHVKKDLKRIGVLAGSFITLLVILSFFIR